MKRNWNLCPTPDVPLEHRKAHGIIFGPTRQRLYVNVMASRDDARVQAIKEKQ